MVKKQLQHKYCPISNEVKANRQGYLVSWYNITREILFFKMLIENEAERLVSDLFLVFKKALYKVKASALLLSFNRFR